MRMADPTVTRNCILEDSTCIVVSRSYTSRTLCIPRRESHCVCATDDGFIQSCCHCARHRNPKPTRTLKGKNAPAPNMELRECLVLLTSGTLSTLGFLGSVTIQRSRSKRV